MTLDRRIRSARTLVFVRHEGEVLGFNYLSKTTFICSHDLLTFLAMIDDWTEIPAVGRLLPYHAPDALAEAIDDLIDMRAVTVEHSDLALFEESFERGWKWGIPAALFHFSVQDPEEHLSLEESEDRQVAKLQAEPQPELYSRSPANCEVLRLPQADSDLLRLMARRRTVRTGASEPITLEQLSDCLRAGLGIVGETGNRAGRLPLSMTPSGGARHPYEAYVVVKSVDGLAPGTYHYAAIDHSLARVNDSPPPMFSELVGGQGWADEMPCLVCLCARLERTMWKYDDPNAYRVVLIEAGHIGQNVMLAATSHGLTACPTAALNHSRINSCISDDNSITHAPIYALTLGFPAATAAVVR